MSLTQYSRRTVAEIIELVERASTPCLTEVVRIYEDNSNNSLFEFNSYRAMIASIARSELSQRRRDELLGTLRTE